jgi:TerY-like protein
MTTRNIVVVMSRCSRSKQGYGIRFERKAANQWVATWSFAVKDSVAKREGYEKAEMSGSFTLGDGFPGCPHCSAHGFFHCGCGKLGCWNGESRTVTCPWCAQHGELGGEITSLDGGTDR